MPWFAASCLHLLAPGTHIDQSIGPPPPVYAYTAGSGFPAASKKPAVWNGCDNEGCALLGA